MSKRKKKKKKREQFVFPDEDYITLDDIWGLAAASLLEATNIASHRGRDEMLLASSYAWQELAMRISETQEHKKSQDFGFGGSNGTSG